MSRDPSQYASAINDSYVDMGRETAANGFCKAIFASNPSYPQEQRVYGDIFNRDNSGSSNTFFCDYDNHAKVNNSIYALVLGGNSFYGVNNGLACLVIDGSPDTKEPFVGSRLCWS